MYTIQKEFHFSASHQLSHLPDDHQCARLHGHNYILVVKISSNSLNRVGFVIDYGDLDFVKRFVDELDHRHLNRLFPFNPTSENICAYLHSLFLKRLYALDAGLVSNSEFNLSIGLSETPKTWAWYS